MFEQKILFYKLFSSSKIVGAIKDKVEGYFCQFKMPQPVPSEARAAF